jgi:hypothetical protein
VTRVHLPWEVQGWVSVHERGRGVRRRRLAQLLHTEHGVSDAPSCKDKPRLMSLTADVDPDAVNRFTGWSPKTSSYAGAASCGFEGFPMLVINCEIAELEVERRNVIEL